MTKRNKQAISFILIAVIIVLVDSLFAQKITTSQYINTYKDLAIKKHKKYGIPASITLAQGILESGSGNSKLARHANNHFGIKCHKGWSGKKYYIDDDTNHECFRKYKKAEDSYNDHSEFLTQRGRYSFLFEYSSTDYKKWAYGLKKAGYATNPKYPELLIKIIEKYNLDKYDKNYKKNERDVNADDRTTKKTDNYTAITIANYKQIKSWSSGRKMFKNNGIKLIIIEKGDTFNGLAEEFEIYQWQFKKYNDLEKDHVLKIGEIIYLEKKKRKADKKYPIHVVKPGETMHRISQLYCIKLTRLYKINNLPQGIQVEAGTKIQLR